MKTLLIRNGVKVNQYYRLINSSLNYFILDENEVIWIDDVPLEECEEEVIREFRSKILSRNFEKGGLNL